MSKNVVKLLKGCKTGVRRKRITFNRKIFVFRRSRSNSSRGNSSIDSPFPINKSTGSTSDEEYKGFGLRQSNRMEFIDELNSFISLSEIAPADQFNSRTFGLTETTKDNKVSVQQEGLSDTEVCFFLSFFLSPFLSLKNLQTQNIICALIFIKALVLYHISITSPSNWLLS